jgi:HEPN domain-containing protein
MKAITQSWLNYAKIDLQSCKKLLEDEFLTNSAAFHARQVVEKCFKAV